MEDFVMVDVPPKQDGNDLPENGADLFIDPTMLLVDEGDSMQHAPTSHQVHDDYVDTAAEPELESHFESLSSNEDVANNSAAAALWKPTGCCYDERMTYHINPDSLGQPHPEAPERITEIMRSFRELGLVFSGTDEELRIARQSNPTRYMHRIRARPALKAEICTVHTAITYDWAENLENSSVEKLREFSNRMDAGRKSLYVSALTFQAALLAAGGAIETCKNVVVGNVKNAIAVIRPPGHHAEANESMGFCIFNNVPVAAKICQIEYPELCKKVLILDWDVHHGNGTQNMFYEDPNVLYISLHVYADGTFYPGEPASPDIPDGGLENVGSGAGVGRNINIPWHAQGMGDGEYMSAFQKIVMPIALEYEPDLVIISAGFDAAAGDELGGCFVSPACYAHMTHMLMSLAGGKLAVCLEGGYNINALKKSAEAVAETLMGIPPPKLNIPPVHYKAVQVLDRVMEVHAPYWECMRKYRIPTFELGAQRLHDVIRHYQYTTMREEFGMLPLYVMRDSLYKSFEYQVLVTPNINTASRILLILHDPPDILAKPNPADGKLDPHNAWMVDGIVDYVSWATKSNFGVVDINIPAHITRPHVKVHPEGYIPPMGESDATPLMQELMTWLWDNNLDLWAAEQIILMGVGDANFGNRMLLTLRDRSNITGVLNFIEGSLRPVKSETDESLTAWYKNHSQIYVAADHDCWRVPELEKKVRKRRFGTVIKSDTNGLNQMLKRHLIEATSWIKEMVGDEEEDEEDDDEAKDVMKPTIVEYHTNGIAMEL